MGSVGPKIASLFWNIGTYGNTESRKIMFSYIPETVDGYNLRTKLHECGYNESSFSLKLAPPNIKMVTERFVSRPHPQL